MNRSSSALTVVLLLVLAIPAIGSPFRTWTDATGKHLTVAVCRGHKNGMVILEQKDGAILKVPFQKLSPADQQWLKQYPSGIEFDFLPVLFGTPSSLSAFVQAVDAAAGTVQIEGGDSKRPTIPFAWEWGDGTRAEGYFPQRHTYTDHGRSYLVQVTARYPDGTHDTAEVLVVMGVAHRKPALPSNQLFSLAVTFPTEAVVLSAAVPGFTAPALPPFDPSAFGVVPRETIEHVLTAAAAVQMECVGSDVSLRNGEFRQVALWDKGFPGMYSLWFTDSSPATCSVAREITGRISRWATCCSKCATRREKCAINHRSVCL